MSQLTLLHGARQLLTLRGPAGARRGSALLDLGIIQDGSVLIQDGQILAVGPTRRLENLKIAKSAAQIDVSDHIIMPGLVDPNIRFTLAELTGGEISRPRRLSAMQEKGATLLRSCLQHGTVAATLAVDAETGELRSNVSLLRQAAKIAPNPVDIARSWRVPGSPCCEQQFVGLCDVLQAVLDKRLVSSLAVRCGPPTPFSRNWHSILASTRLPVTLDWSANEEPDEFRSTAQSLRPTAVFCSSFLRGDQAMFLANCGVQAVFAPGTELGRKMGGGLREFVAAGGAIALSSGYHPLESPGFSMQMAISLAIVQGQLTDEEAISAATVNAAYAAGRGHLTGTLEVGKRADLLVLGVPHYREIARQFGINHVHTVLREGNVVYNRGRWKLVTHENNSGGVRSQSVGRA